MSDDKHKTLNYRRAIWNPSPPDSNGLEGYIVKAFRKLRTIGERSFIDSEGITYEERHYKHRKGLGCFLHLAAYTEGEHASVVPKKQNEEEADLDTKPPPQGSEYMNGDLMLLVNGNNLIICTSDLHEKCVRVYLRGIFEKAHLPDDARAFILEKVADVNKVTLIANQGVKRIRFDSTLFEATDNRIQRETKSQSIMGAAADQILALLKKDKKWENVSARQNLSVSVTITCDARFNKSRIIGAGIDKLAMDTVNEDEEGFVIETRNGEKIRQDEIVVRKPIKVPPFGKTVSHQAVWDEMEDYFKDLKDRGVLEQ